MTPARFPMLVVATAIGGCSSSFPAPGNFAADQGSTQGQTQGSGTTSEPVLPSCADSSEAMGDCVERDRYVTDLTFIAAQRVPGDAHWQEVQNLCFDRFTELGYDVELHQYGTGINVVGTKLGTTTPEATVVVAAHYDHIPGCPGADDNATGVAGVLEIARVLAQAQFERTVVVACWDQEEIGLIGSRSWVLRANNEPFDIVANFNFEMIGYTNDAANSQSVPPGFDVLFPAGIAELEANDYAGNFITVVADDLATEPAAALERHADRLGLPFILLPLPAELKNSPLLSDLRRSDHAPFWEFDHPAMMLTDTSNFRYSAYHCLDGVDAIDNLDHAFSTLVLQMSTAAITDTLGLVSPVAPG